MVAIVAGNFPLDRPHGVPDLSVNGHSLLLFDTPSEAISALKDLPLLEQTNQVKLSYKNGAFPYQGQLYVRLAYEKRDTIISSESATVYNFSQRQSVTNIELKDLLDKEGRYTLVQFDVISYWRDEVPRYQYAFARLR